MADENVEPTIVAKKREEVKDDLSGAGDRARDRPGGYAEAPNFHLHGDSDDDQKDGISESESNCSEQWYELDGQEQEALISLRGTKETYFNMRQSQEDSTQKEEAVQGAQENPSMS